MGRELCISLTSVVLEAINTVERAKQQSRQSSPAKPSPQSQQQQQQWESNSSSDSGADPAEKSPQEQPSAPVERKRPSSARLSRGGSPLAVGSDGGEGGGREGRARADSAGMIPVRRVVKGESVAGAAGLAKVFHKEDPGLKDLDRREEEFRKVLYLSRMICTRIMHATNWRPHYCMYIVDV